jgi:hypothetical protein
MYQPKHAYKPKHARRKRKFMERPGQQTSLIGGLVALSFGVIFVTPDYPGAKPMLAYHPIWAAVLCLSTFISGWFAGSLMYRKRKNKK